MRTSNCEENNEEVNGHLQSEPNDQQENLDNSTSSITINISSESISSGAADRSSSSFNYSIKEREICSGCRCRQIFSEYKADKKAILGEAYESPTGDICYCDSFKSCCRSQKEDISTLFKTVKYQDTANKDIVFDLLKNSKPLRPVSVKTVQKTGNGSDSDIEVDGGNDKGKVPAPKLSELFNHERKDQLKTYQSLANHSRLGKRARTSGSSKLTTTTTATRQKRLRTAKENRDYRELVAPSSVSPVSSKKGRKRKSSENEDPGTKFIRTEFVDCTPRTDQDQQEDEDPRPCSSTSDYKPPLSTTNRKRKTGHQGTRQINYEHQENTDAPIKEDMYDYRFADPQLPSSTSYYTSSSSKSSAVATEEQQNTTNATTQNLLDSNKTIATLCNIGNSCYLNSVVYTLRFAPLFLHKLHHLIEDMATIYIKLNPTKHKSSSLGRNVSLWQGHSGRSWSSKDLASLGSITGNDSLPKNNRLVSF